jgi:hypothetical protein
MILFRAIEFSKLSFMLSESGREIWESTIHDFKESQSRNSNWWFDTSFQDKIQYIIADIIQNGEAEFFQNSLTYNSTVGGRYNPSNSFGILYASSNPLLSSLEVLYHIFDNKRKFLNNVAKNSEEYPHNFDSESPTHIKKLIVVFSIEFDESGSNLRDCTDSGELKSLLERVGFARYTGNDSYDDDFIFGNNYEVSRILGCHLNTLDDSKAIKFKSARIVNSLGPSSFFNVVFPETFVKQGDLKLTQNYFLCDAAVSIHEDAGAHDVLIKMYGQDNEVPINIRLEKYLDEKRTRSHFDRLKEYLPELPDELQPRLNKRRVLFQRFRDNTP